MSFDLPVRPGRTSAAWLFLFLLTLTPGIGQAAGFEKVNELYRGKFDKSPQGVYVAAGLVFVVVEINNPDKSQSVSSKRKLLSEKLSRSRRLFFEHLVRAYYPKKAEVKQSPLLEQYPFVRELVAKHFPGLILPQFSFRGASHELEDFTHDDKHRYVVAYYEKELKSEIPEELVGAKTEDIILALKMLRQKYRTDADSSLLNRFHLQTGAQQEALSHSGRQLAAEYPLACFPAKPVEDLALLYAALEEANGLLKGNPSAKDIARALQKAPALPRALDQLAALCRKKDRHLQAANIQLMRLIGSANRKDGWVKVLADVRTQAKVGNPNAHQQYQKLLADFSTKPISGVYEAKEDSRGVLRKTWQTFGHLNFPDAWSAEQPQGYQKAMELFAAGGDVNQMIVHLKGAVLKSPRHASSWNLLGRCLMIQKKYIEALPTLNLAARLSDDALPRTNLAICYEQLKHPELARGMALAVLLAPNNIDWSLKEANRIIAQ